MQISCTGAIYILQTFQSRAARLITGATYDVRSADVVLDTLSWETLDVKRSYKKICFYVQNTE